MHGVTNGPGAGSSGAEAPGDLEIRVTPRAIVLTPAVSAPSPAPELDQAVHDARPHGCDIPAFEVGRHYFNHAHGMSKWPSWGRCLAGESVVQRASPSLQKRKALTVVARASKVIVEIF